ncbi:MAG: BMP family ABC transporter substrate-binding protein [Burkholderiales bacterium]|jgi:simple sugar transport system substrate-binding protein|nr:BMP family ABC transporter substrate-binding protein [Burkholderiales bacterium]
MSSSVAVLPRRRALAALGAAATVAAFGSRPARAAPKPVIGFIAAGPWNDLGYTQGHLDGIKALAAAMPQLKVLKEERVPEAVEVRKTMQSMIELDGANIVVATAYGYFDPHVLAVAPKYPQVQFFHCGGIKSPQHPANVHTYYAWSDEVAYAEGVTAGAMAKTGKLGFVGSKAIPDLVRVVNCFATGARSVNPQASVRVIFTGDWANPAREAEAVNALADQGIEVIGCDVDEPKVFMETCERRKVLCTGRHTNLAALAPTRFLTGAEWKWATPYRQFVDAALAGRRLDDNLRGAMAQDYVRLSPFGPGASAKARDATTTALAELASGKRALWPAGLKDQNGKVRIAAGKPLAISDPVLEQIDWLAEGILGTVKT